MKEEANHLIEYYTVMKQAGVMIFGENTMDLNRPSIGGEEEEGTPSAAQKYRHSDGSDGSDDVLFNE